MKNTIKFIAGLLFIELVFFSAVMPKGDMFNTIKETGSRWIFAYMLFIVSLFAAIYIKNPVVFGAAFVLCSAGAFVLEKKSLVLLAPVALLIWIFLNFVKKANESDLSSSKHKGIITAADVVIPVLCVAVIIAAFPLNMRPGLVRAFNLTLIRIYVLPAAVFLIYYFYSLVFKSKIPVFQKIKERH